MAISETLEWTDGDKDVTVEAESGTLYVTLESGSISFERERGRLDTVKGRDVLNCGTMRDDSGEKFRALVTLGSRRDELEQLKEDSEPEQTDEPLVYMVEEYTTTVGRDWKHETEKTRLVPNKERKHMTDRQRELARKVDTDHGVPDDADPGDEYGLDDLLADARTTDEKEQDALDEAVETGEEVTISKTTTQCNDSGRECNLDHVRRVATPSGDVETRRTHTY